MKKKLTKAERRVAVARDALRQVEAKKLIAEAGTYIYFGRAIPQDAVKNEKAFQRFVRDEKCHVCARGALFISTVRKEDSFAPSESNHYVRRSEFDPRLMELFSEGQLKLIENFFEFDGCYDYHEDKDRLVLILKNIIKNKGTFVLPKAKKAE